MSFDLKLDNHDIETDHVMLLGCGGGYDIFTGLPIYFNICDKQSKCPVLVSFSFTNIDLLEPFKVTDECYKIQYDGSVKDELYFPEYHLSQHLGQPVYAISTDTSISKYKKVLKHIINIHKIDTIIAVDGGCDSMMFGMEEELGTPVEDMMTIFILHKLKQEGFIKHTYLSCLGTSVELISYNDFIKNCQTIKTQTKLVNKIDLVNIFQNKSIGWEYISKYIDVFKKCQTHNSIINSSIVAALEGHTGRYENPLTGNRISLKKNYPLLDETTAELWIFDLDTVANNIIYLSKLEELDSNTLIDIMVTVLNDTYWPEGAKYNLNEIYTKELIDKVQPIVDIIIQHK